MKAFSNFLFILAGIVVLIGIGYFGYRFYQRLNAPAESPVKAIPRNTALIIRLNKPAQFWQETSRNNRLWNDLFSVPYLDELRKQVNLIDSLAGRDAVLSGALKSNPLWITLSPAAPHSFGLLYMINLPGDDPDETIGQFLENKFASGISIEKTGYGGSIISHVVWKKRKTGFFFSNSSGIFLASVHESLIKQALDQLSLNLGDQEDLSFSKVLTRSGKNVDANLFVNYNNIAPFVAGLTTHGMLSEFLNVSNFAAWSGIDLIQKKDQWLISGNTVCNDTLSHYLTLFSGQQPQEMEIQDVIPGNVSSLTWIGLDKPGKFLDKLVSSKSGTSIYLTGFSGLIKFETENNVILRDHFLPWIGNEISAAVLINPVTLLPGETYGIFKVTDPDLADSLLNRLGNVLNGNPPTVSYKGSQIRNLNLLMVIPGIWGNLFQRLGGSYYTFVSDYVIFGNSAQSLEMYLDKISSGDILGKDPDFKEFRENISTRSNLCFYYNTSGSYEELRTYLAEEINREIIPVADTLKKFAFFGAQIINNGEDFITNLFIQHDRQEHMASGPLVWQTNLENPVSGTPLYIVPEKSGTPEVVALDDASNLYLLDQDGKIKWKMKIAGKPLGGICKVRSEKSGSVLLAFNTEDLFGIVDLNGVYCNNSPFKLPMKAVNGLACPDGDILYLQLSDKRIHAFDLQGREVKGWAKPAMTEVAVKPMQFLTSKGRDYYLLTARNGQALVCDKNGRQIIKPAGKIPFSPSSAFYINKTNSKGDLLTSSIDGRLIYLRSDGKSSDLKFNNFTSNHVFYYADINDDNVQEFIYFDMNKVYCYNRFQKLLFDYTFPAPVMEPILATCPTGEFILGTVAPKTGEIFLFGKKGRIPVDQAVSGNTLFDLMKLNKNDGMYLVTGAGKTVKCYLLPQ